MHRRRFTPWIDCLLLMSPVGAYSILARDIVAFPSLGLAYLRGQSSQHRCNVAGIEGGVYTLYQGALLRLRMFVHMQAK
jgi:hypothetical protein